MKGNLGVIKWRMPKAKYGDLFFVLIALLYKSMLDWSYIILSNVYKMQFQVHMNELKLFISYIVVLILSLLTVRKRGTKVFLIRMILFMTIIPNTSVYGMRDESSLFFAWVTSSFALVEVVVLRLKFKQKKKLDQRLGRSILKTDNLGIIIDVIFALFSIMTIILMCRQNGLPGTLALDLYKVYEVRSSYRASKYLNYAISIVSTVIVPFGLADSYVTNSIWKLAFYTMIQVLLFLWTGNKVFLFVLLLIAAVIFIGKLNLSLNLYFYGMTFIAALGNLSSIYGNRLFDLIFSLVNRRMLLDSATIKYFYYDYFIINRNPVLGFSGTILAPLLGRNISSEYRKELSFFYTGKISNANTGLYGGDFANLGIWAFIIVHILIIILFQLIGRIEKRCGSKFAVAFFVFTVYYLNERCIFVYMFDFTGILLVTIVMLYRFKTVEKARATLCYNGTG